MVDIKEENFYDVYPESEALRKQNYEDGQIPIIGLQPELDLARYKILNTQGALVLVTARDAKKLIGYHISIVLPHIHFATIKFGFNDSYVVDRNYRGQGIFNMMLAMSEHAWIMRGAQIGQMNMRGDCSSLLKRGYIDDEKILVKRLEV